MFSKKYRATVLNKDWSILIRNFNFRVLPRQDEYIFFNGLYYLVLNVVHTIDKNRHGVFVIVNESAHQEKNNLNT